jgi:hypothetical protein
MLLMIGQCFLLGCASRTAALGKFEFRKDSIEIDVLKYLNYIDSTAHQICAYTKPEIEYQINSDTCIVTIIRQDRHDFSKQKSSSKIYGNTAEIIFRINLRKKTIIDGSVSHF